MSVKPILFNTEMVKAILEGRKTCTRRIVKPQPKSKLCYTFAGGSCGTWGYPSPSDHEIWGKEYRLPNDITKEDLVKRWKPPYHTDDILYVRETVWQKIGYYLDVDGETKPSWYNEFRYVASDEKPETGWNYSWAKRPSIHMPKEAARIWLKVTDVRVERLKDITGLSVQKEGIEVEPNECAGKFDFISELFFLFQRLWDSTVKKSDLDCYGWNANPWVWVIEFERCKKPESEE